jgi:sugar phosphate isomerase/epimerase
LPSIARWAASLGYEGVQIPTWDGRLFDLSRAAESQDYCDEVKGICEEAGVRDHRTVHPTSRASSWR